jgi:DNA-binding GntR family transcriptional regulator
MDQVATGDAPDAAAAWADAGLDNDQIYGRIFEAIVEHRLLPGTHLKEDELGAIFGIGRTRVRAILSRLAADHIVELVANRGAFVSQPSVDEAREVFRARRLIEEHLVRRAAENPTAALRSALEHHLGHEKAARDAGDQGAVIRRCSRFHQVLADQADSPIMARFLRELIARSALIVAVYEARPPDDCELEEHQALTELVLAGRADEAVALMDRHLRGIEDRLDLRPRSDRSSDLIVAFPAADYPRVS